MDGLIERWFVAATQGRDKDAAWLEDAIWLLVNHQSSNESSTTSTSSKDAWSESGMEDHIQSLATPISLAAIKDCISRLKPRTKEDVSRLFKSIAYRNGWTRDKPTQHGSDPSKVPRISFGRLIEILKEENARGDTSSSVTEFTPDGKEVWRIEYDE
jgi:hypothetical protein